MEKSMGISIPSVNNSIVSYEQSQVTNVNNKGRENGRFFKESGKALVAMQRKRKQVVAMSCQRQ